MINGKGILAFVVASIAVAGVRAQTDADREIGRSKFETHCLTCHTGVLPEAPLLEALKLYPPERIIESLTSGIMSTAGLPLSEFEIRQVAYYLTGKTPQASKPAAAPLLCPSSIPRDTELARGDWTSWGGKGHGKRFQGSEKILNPDNVKDLKLRWAFAFPDATRVRSQPTVTDKVTYIGSQAGMVYALDTDTGCMYWTFQADSEVRGAIALHEDPASGARTLLFGDFKANAYAVDAVSGKALWKVRVHDHELATITGSVTADRSQVYVPISSSEVVPAGSATYPCCTFRGAIVALNIIDGAIAWRTFTTEEPTLRGKNSAGAKQFGPSGAPIWSSPTLDYKRGLVIATTGQNYSSPATGTSDAVIAMDRANGKVKWVSQVTANDAWNGACVRKTANCPKENGPDFDIGASAILVQTRQGRDILLVGQKSGLVYGLDPDQEGKILWRQRVGSGGTMGGVHWGMSSDGERLYVGVSDLPTRNPYAEGEPHPGVNALDPVNGAFIWRTPAPNTCPDGLKFMCFPGISAAVSSSPGLVFSGGLDGVLRALDARSGAVLWSFETRRTFSAVNGAVATGGAIEADGPIIAHGKVFATSGYDKWAESPGNALLVFGLDKP